MFHNTSLKCVLKLNYFLSEFPGSCSRYFGPNDKGCYSTIWMNEGCLDKGWKSPNNLTRPELLYLGTCNLRLVYKSTSSIQKQSPVLIAT